MKPLVREETREFATGSLDLLSSDMEDVCAGHGIDPEHLERALYGDARAFLARPGKAFRARLIEGCFSLVADPSQVVPAAALESIELLHGGSLIVDDIQDDAVTRRGAPALHRMIGTPRALNTGNWLYFVALSRLDSLALERELASELTHAAHRCLMRCHEGQALDLALRVGDLRRAELAHVVRFVSVLKTGALTGFAARLGASVAGGASAAAIEGLSRFGERVGVALQMLDDLGSFVAEGRHHKAREDLLGQRASWVWSWASETLDEHTFKQLVKQLSREGEGELEALRERLADAVEPLARTRVHEALEQARCELSLLFAPSHALDAVHAELTTLERSYG
ncbi:MAG: Polyprenyl synthetase [Myxococcaceae bacterium]|nr:Polyprenyl synthetase [Myxococcaceae bacterium]